MQQLSRRERLRKSLELPKATPAPAPHVSTEDPLEGLRQPFVNWFDENYTIRPHFSAGLVCLHIHFCEWLNGHNQAVCDRAMFRLLLSELCFPIDEVNGAQLVCGLITRVDLEAVEQFQKDDENNDYFRESATEKKLVSGEGHYKFHYTSPEKAS